MQTRLKSCGKHNEFHFLWNAFVSSIISISKARDQVFFFLEYFPAYLESVQKILNSAWNYMLFSNKNKPWWIPKHSTHPFSFVNCSRRK